MPKVVKIERDETLKLLKQRGYCGDLTYTSVFKWLKKDFKIEVLPYRDDYTFKGVTPNRWRFTVRHLKYPGLGFQSYELFCESREEASMIALLWLLRDHWPYAKKETK